MPLVPNLQFIGDHFWVVRNVLQRENQISMDPGVLRIELDCAAQRVDRPLKVADVFKSIGEIVVKRRPPRFSGDGAAKRGQRFVGFPQIFEHEPEAGESFDEVRLQFHRARYAAAASAGRLAWVSA